MVARAGARESQDYAGRCWERLVGGFDSLNPVARVRGQALQAVLSKQVEWITLRGAAKISMCG